MVKFYSSSYNDKYCTLLFQNNNNNNNNIKKNNQGMCKKIDLNLTKDELNISLAEYQYLSRT